MVESMGPMEPEPVDLSVQLDCLDCYYWLVDVWYPLTFSSS